MPLLLYVWRMNRADMTELLLEYGVDSTMLYSADPSKEQGKPLFFQVNITNHLVFLYSLNEKIKTMLML